MPDHIKYHVKVHVAGSGYTSDVTGKHDSLDHNAYHISVADYLRTSAVVQPITIQLSERGKLHILIISMESE